MTHEAVLPELSRWVPQRWLSILGEIRKSYRDWAHRRRVFTSTYNELARCSDRDLADIAIPRCNIRFIAAEAARMATEEQAR